MMLGMKYGDLMRLCKRKSLIVKLIDKFFHIELLKVIGQKETYIGINRDIVTISTYDKEKADDFISKEKEKINIEDDVLNLIAKYSDGGLRDAINLFDKLVCCSSNVTVDDFYEIKGIVKEEELEKILKYLLVNDIKSIFDEIDTLNKKGKNLILFAI